LSYDKAALAAIENLYHELGTGPEGLSDQEARLRLQKYGPNVLPMGHRDNLAQRFLIQFKNMFNILLLVASFLSFASGIAYGDDGSLQMGLAILSVVLLNAFFSLFQEHRAERAVKAISVLVPKKTKALREGQVKEVDVTDVVPGDILSLEEGDRVPADLRLTSAFEVTVDNSTLTGESEPRRRFATMPPNMLTGNPLDLQNILFTGTTMVSGVARGIALFTAKETQFGRIVSLSTVVKEPMSVLQKDIDYTAKINLLVALIVSAIFFSVALLFVGLSIVDGIMFAIGVAICLVPEGFQLTVSLSLALTALIMAKRNVVIKRLSSVETLGSMTAMCVDKTGTITSGEMMVEKLWASGRIFEVTGDGYSPNGFITFDGHKINGKDWLPVHRVIEASAFCNNAELKPPSDRIGRWSVLGDPTDGAFLVFATKGGFNVSNALAENPRIGIIPFDSHRRMMTSIHMNPEGAAMAYTKGAGSEVLAHCINVFDGDEDECLPLTDELRDAITRQMDNFASEGLRVLALASRDISGSEELTKSPQDIEKGMTFLGLAALHDPPRPKVAEAVREAKRAGIRVLMLTGDHELTAYSIAKKVGIITTAESKVVTGRELSEMSDEDLKKILIEGECAFARITPEQKLRIVQILKANGEVVALTGDGVNDSPALIEANAGIAMGVGGTDVARESADMVLLDNDFTSIVEAGKLGRAAFDNLRKFVYYVYTHNFAELLTFIAFVLLRTPLPLLVIQVLAIDLGMDVAPSLSLIMEPPDPAIMMKSPRKSRTRLINITMIIRSAVVGSIIGAGAVLYAFSVWHSGGWTLGMSGVPNPLIYARGTSIVMSGIMIGQLGNLLATRTDSKFTTRPNPLKNRWLFPAIFIEFVVMAVIIYVPFLQPLFGTAPLLPSDWLFLSLLAPLAFILEELRKSLSRKK
jgi:Ca2+-transporting ATPase